MTTSARKTVFAIVLLCISVTGSFVAPALAAPVAMVTDLQGSATASIDGQSRKVAILTELEPGASISLGAGATLVALYVDTGEEYAFKGPATIVFKPAVPQTADGAAAERRGPALGKGAGDVRIKPAGVTQLAMVMRGNIPRLRIELLTPDKTMTLETHPSFAWKAPEPGLKYAFRLEDDDGYSVVESEVEGTSFTLPAAVQITEGRMYSWRVSARTSGGRKYSSESTFAVAGRDLRAKAQLLRPAPSALLSKRIAYAAWLEQMDLKEEARKYWQAASGERPEDPHLKALAEE
jgi:hypothetical protein